MIGNRIAAEHLSSHNTATRDFGPCRNREVNNQVPLGRYFFFVGSLLLALLFFADRYLPISSSQTFMREARVDKSIIRIKSAHRWPEKIVFDTTSPTIVPSVPALVLAEAPVIINQRQKLSPNRSGRRVF